MTFTTLVTALIDIVAALTLTFAIYYRRHRRRDLVVAFLGVNVGVLAVTIVLATADVAVGLGLGLFGVLSIIRLRSSEISQREVAYYFAALAMGLIGGLSSSNWIVSAALIALIVVIMWVADHPSLLPHNRHQTIKLDRAITDENTLRLELERRLGAAVSTFTVQSTDLVNDSTLVDVRYRIAPDRASQAGLTVSGTRQADNARA